jgi:hypothetical protein
VAAAADVSFERSVCEALLGRRTTAAGPGGEQSSPSAGNSTAPAASSPPAAGTAAAASSAHGTAVPISGAITPAKPSAAPSSISGEEWDEGEEVALLRRLEAKLLMAATAAGVDAVSSSSLEGEGTADAALSFSVSWLRKRTGLHAFCGSGDGVCVMWANTVEKQPCGSHVALQRIP